jgi:hypothetical protein
LTGEEALRVTAIEQVRYKNEVQTARYNFYSEKLTHEKSALKWLRVPILSKGRDVNATVIVAVYHETQTEYITKQTDLIAENLFPTWSQLQKTERDLTDR